LNFTNKSQPVTFKESAFDLLEGQKLQGHAEIPPYGVHFIRLTSKPLPVPEGGNTALREVT
jgi:hypothetical protein